jgi:hypothetical protein
LLTSERLLKGPAMQTRSGGRRTGKVLSGGFPF